MATLSECLRGSVLDVIVIMLMIGAHEVIVEPADAAYRDGIPYSDKDLWRRRAQEKNDAWALMVTVDVAILVIVKPLYVIYLGRSEKKAGGTSKARSALRRYACLRLKMFLAYLIIYLIVAMLVLGKQPDETDDGDVWVEILDTIFQTFFSMGTAMFGGVTLLILSVPLLLYPAYFAMVLAQCYKGPSVLEDGQRGVEMQRLYYI